MKPLELTVRCLVWSEQGRWVATCIDFALAAQAQSQHEARAKLHAQIASYVREAVTIDARHADELLSRSAPLRDRLRFAFWDAMNHRPRLRRTVGQLVRRAGLALKRKLAYCEPLPLLPA